MSFLVILSIWGLVTHCVTPSQKSPVSSESRQSFLWQAQKGEQILTLVGTMHVGITPDDMDPLIWKRLGAADTVIIETDIGESNPRLMQRFMILPTGYDLQTMFGPKYWRKFYEALRDSGSTSDETQLKRMSPLSAGILLLQAQAKSEDEIKAGQMSIDQIIFDRGKRMEKKTATFETNEQQLNYLKKVFTIDTLKKMLDDWDDESASYDTMKNAFLNGDSAALDVLLDDVPKEIRADLLDARNHNWIKELPRLASQRHTLIAVGAAHFAGPEGLLKLLEKEGYSIRSLQTKP